MVADKTVDEEEETDSQPKARCSDGEVPTRHRRQRMRQRGGRDCWAPSADGFGHFARVRFSRIDARPASRGTCLIREKRRAQPKPQPPKRSLRTEREPLQVDFQHDQCSKLNALCAETEAAGELGAPSTLTDVGPSERRTEVRQHR